VSAGAIGVTLGVDVLRSLRQLPSPGLRFRVSRLLSHERLILIRLSGRLMLDRKKLQNIGFSVVTIGTGDRV